MSLLGHQAARLTIPGSRAIALTNGGMSRLQLIEFDLWSSIHSPVVVELFEDRYQLLVFLALGHLKLFVESVLLKLLVDLI